MRTYRELFAVREFRAIFVAQCLANAAAAAGSLALGTATYAATGNSVLRPVFLAGCVPNGLVVGCESLFVPFGGHRAGYLLAVTAAGMLCGDIVVGRVLPAAARTWLVEPLRFLLAAPYVLFLLDPPLPVALGLGLRVAGGHRLPDPRPAPHPAVQPRGGVTEIDDVGLRAT